MKGFVSVYKLLVKCFESHLLGDPVSEPTLVSCPYLRVLSKYKNVSKKNRML